MTDSTLARSLEDRFGTDPVLPPEAEGPGRATLELLAAHRSHRAFADRPVSHDLVDLLCACALSAPSKSDLQQRDIVIVEDAAIREGILTLLPSMPWLRQAPVFLVFCINGRRVPQLAEWRGKPFPNNHLDLLFNGTGDAAIAMAWFIAAAESVGLGTCPISAIRDVPDDISDLLGLPDRVVPYAGMCLGWPAREGAISPRLPLSASVHRNRFSEDGLREAIDAYDRRREAAQPSRRQRDTGRWGEADTYGWSEDKARQYAEPLRAGFGAYVRERGFSTE